MPFMSATIIAIIFIALSGLLPAAAIETQAKWQQHTLSFTELVEAQQGKDISFPNLFVFNQQSTLVAMGRNLSTGLFKHFYYQKLPTRPLPLTAEISNKLTLITPKLTTQAAKPYTIVLVIPDKSVVFCEACNSAFDLLDNQLADAPAQQFDLHLFTVIRD